MINILSNGNVLIFWSKIKIIDIFVQKKTIDIFIQLKIINLKFNNDNLLTFLSNLFSIVTLLINVMTDSSIYVTCVILLMTIDES